MADDSKKIPVTDPEAVRMLLALRASLESDKTPAQKDLTHYILLALLAGLFFGTGIILGMALDGRF